MTTWGTAVGGVVVTPDDNVTFDPALKGLRVKASADGVLRIQCVDGSVLDLPMVAGIEHLNFEISQVRATGTDIASFDHIVGGR